MTTPTRPRPPEDVAPPQRPDKLRSQTYVRFRFRVYQNSRQLVCRRKNPVNMRLHHNVVRGRRAWILGIAQRHKLTRRKAVRADPSLGGADAALMGLGEDADEHSRDGHSRDADGHARYAGMGLGAWDT